LKLNDFFSIMQIRKKIREPQMKRIYLRIYLLIVAATVGTWLTGCAVAPRQQISTTSRVVSVTPVDPYQWHDVPIGSEREDARRGTIAITRQSTPSETVFLSEPISIQRPVYIQQSVFLQQPAYTSPSFYYNPIIVPIIALALGFEFGRSRHFRGFRGGFRGYGRR
jgi:hypothetical protein